MKVAIVCDWLLGTGGAERVVLELHHLFPEAPIYTSQYDSDPKLWFGDEWFKHADVRTTWLQNLPKSLKKFLPPLRALSFSRLNLDEYDLVISSSGAEAKFVKTRGLHITYCHAPTHYYWGRYEQYMKHPGFGWLDPLARLGLWLLAGPMRRLDYKAAQRPNYFIANSNFTKQQIKKYYGRDALVIHPPVDVERFKILNKSSISRRGFITAGRQTPYKRIDLAVQAATELNVPLTVVGRGPDHGKLKRLAGPTVTFLPDVSDKQVPEKFASAEAFIFPGVDDFGIVAVEALAAGTPVIAYNKGGAKDYINKETGMAFDKQTVDSLAEALDKFTKKTFDHEYIALQAQRFAPEEFKKNMKAFIAKVTG